jgi:hypothetical protein
MLMSKTSPQEKYRERYNRLKKIFELIFNPKYKQQQPSLVLQPVRQNNLRGTDLY